MNKVPRLSMKKLLDQQAKLPALYLHLHKDTVQLPWLLGQFELALGLARLSNIPCVLIISSIGQTVVYPDAATSCLLERAQEFLASYLDVREELVNKMLMYTYRKE